MAEQTVVESGVIRVDASGRRQYSVEFKRRLAQLALEPGASVAGIALAHRINANQLFKWRQDYLCLLYTSGRPFHGKVDGGSTAKWTVGATRRGGVGIVYSRVDSSVKVG